MIHEHASDELIAGYAEGAELPGDRVWAVEAHLESCALCRARLADAGPAAVPELVDAVWARLAPVVRATSPALPRRRWMHWPVTWATPVLVPWLAVVALVTAAAVITDRLLAGGLSTVQLFAPVLPVLGVAGSWSRGLDPAFEVVAVTPRAGLYLVLRRTTAVLLVVVPVLLVADWLTGAGLGLSLLPGLAFTTGTLALGGSIGMNRAAVVVLGAWFAVLVMPTVATQHPTFALRPGSVPVWCALVALTALVTVLRRDAYTRLGANH